MANNNNTINNTAVVVLAASGVLVSTLPINLASFKGRYENNLKCVQLNWDAYNTAGTVKFEIERSPDGNRFNKVDEVKPSSANEKASYSFNDYTANSSQTNFYRVKQIQQAGQPIYTAVIRVEGTKASLVTLKLMQSANAVEIHNIPLQRVYEYTLMNSASSVVKKGKVSSGDNSILINSLSKGVYYLKLASGNEIQTLKFLR